MGRQSGTPLVSIITPAYNREAYLPQTIESVLAQGFSDWEMIIVDDGSTTNGNRLIAEGYCARDPRISYYHQQHGGPSSARNLAISHARGSFLAFLDSDDRYLKNGLATLVQALQEAPPRVKLVYGDFVKFFQSENRFQPTRARPPLPRPGLYFQFLVPGGNPVVPSASLTDRRGLDEIGYFESRFDGVEDRELWSRLIQRYDIAHVEALVTLYRKHDQQITLNTPLRQIANDRLVSRFFNSLPLSSWFPGTDDDRTMAESLLRLARALLGSRYPTVESALQLLLLAQSKHFDPQREPLISLLESDFRNRCEARNGSQNGHS